MTATLPPRTPVPPPAHPSGHGAGHGGAHGPAPAAGRPTEWDARNSAPRRTLLALLATALGATPLKALLTDWSWLLHGWLAMAVVIGPACLIRLRRAPSALDVWPGIVLLVPWLTLVYVPHHAWGGLIPNGATLHDVRNLMQNLHHTTDTQVAPVHSTVAIRLVVSTLLGLLAALVDLVAVVGRRGALAGVPLLVVFTVAGAVPRSPVAWGWFVVAAIGFLLLLGLDAEDELRDWGRRIARRGVSRGRPGLGISAQRIGLLAVLVAVALPALAPDQSRNLIADAFHNGNGSGIGGFGAGSGGDGSISPFVALKGQLDRGNPVNVASVQVSGPSGEVPFYLRTNVLERYTSDVGWSVGDHGPSEPIEDTDFGSAVDGRPARSVRFKATIHIDRLGGNAPVFTAPQSIYGVAEGTTWNPRDGILLDGKVEKGQNIVEVFDQPAPTIAELRAAPRVAAGQYHRWLDLPSRLPKAVVDLVDQLTASKPTPYDKARALSDYFADPKNGFSYSLKTQPGDSGSALVDFLHNKEGYCQQYAAALGVMLRQVGIPARVVLGYMHTAPDPNGKFDVSTLDAHAWVEAYFPGVGWVPFDPTPAAGLSGGQASDLRWAPHVYPKGGNDPSRPQVKPSAFGHHPTSSAATSSAPAAAAAGGGGSTGTPLWVLAGLVVVLVIVLVPAGARTGRRRRRYRRAAHGDADALWAEVADTVVDLGYRWSPTRSPRQVAAWLARDAGTTAPLLERLAGAVERWRYAPAGAVAGPAAADGSGLVRDWDDVAGTLRARRSWRVRLRALLWPASLGWTPRRGRGPRFHLRRH